MPNNSEITTEVQKPKTHSLESRKILARMSVKLFGRWRLSLEDQLTLLALSSGGRATLRTYARGMPIGDRQDRIERAELLLSIHATLGRLYPQNMDIKYSWVHCKNERFEGRTPLEVMLEGVDGIKRVLQYLDWYCNI